MPLDGTNGYVETVEQNPSLKFNMIIVDGRRRADCLRASINALDDKGVIVLDDSERSEYSEGIDFLTQKNYKRLDFWGIAPGVFIINVLLFFIKLTTA